ncbi:MAG TPA: ankyrin repeat domain-containing protein [Acidothermaceae bacterium]
MPTSARRIAGAQPLHYAADSRPGAANWDPGAQAATIAYLIAAGADPNATDTSGVAPLHRAVRTRGSAAVNALLADGADARRPNRNGSTPVRLATQTTGRGGSGTPQAKTEQREIVRLWS